MNLKKLKIKNISFLLMILFITVNINAQNFLNIRLVKLIMFLFLWKLQLVHMELLQHLKIL